MCHSLAKIVKKVKVLVTQSCPTVCDPVNCSLPGSSVHGISQARILGWVAIPFSRGSSWPRDQTWVPCIAGRFFTIWAIGEAQPSWYINLTITMRSYEIMLGPKSNMTGVPIRRRLFGHRHTGPCEDRGRDWNDASTVQGIPKIANNHQELRRVNEGFFRRALMSVL